MARKVSSPNYVVPNLERGLLILEYLREHPDGKGISDISNALDYPLNSVFRITNTLLKHNYVQRSEGSKKFSLTRKLMSLGCDSPADEGLMERSLDVMRELRDELGETVVVSILDGREGLVLEQVPGRHSFRFVCDPGTRQVAHTSASCKAILAFLPKDDRETALEQLDFAEHTPNTITDLDAFRAELAAVRDNGYAVDRGEAIEGVHCVAAAILDRKGAAVAAITVTGPASRMPASRFPDVGEVVRAHTARISKRFGYGLVSGPNGGTCDA